MILQAHLLCVSSILSLVDHNSIMLLFTPVTYCCTDTGLIHSSSFYPTTYRMYAFIA